MKMILTNNEILHVKSDWYKTYILSAPNNLDGARAVMKIRDIKTDKVLCEPECVIVGNNITVHIPWELSANIPRNISKAYYDMFIVIPLDKGTIQYKVVMGEFKIIHDASMHK